MKLSWLLSEKYDHLDQSVCAEVDAVFDRGIRGYVSDGMFVVSESGGVVIDQSKLMWVGSDSLLGVVAEASFNARNSANSSTRLEEYQGLVDISSSGWLSDPKRKPSDSDVFLIRLMWSVDPEFDYRVSDAIAQFKESVEKSSINMLFESADITTDYQNVINNLMAPSSKPYIASMMNNQMEYHGVSRILAGSKGIIELHKGAPEAQANKTGYFKNWVENITKQTEKVALEIFNQKYAGKGMDQNEYIKEYQTVVLSAVAIISKMLADSYEKKSMHQQSISMGLLAGLARTKMKNLHLADTYLPGLSDAVNQGALANMVQSEFDDMHAYSVGGDSSMTGLVEPKWFKTTIVCSHKSVPSAMLTLLEKTGKVIMASGFLSTFGEKARNPVEVFKLLPDIGGNNAAIWVVSYGSEISNDSKGRQMASATDQYTRAALRREVSARKRRGDAVIYAGPDAARLRKICGDMDNLSDGSDYDKEIVRSAEKDKYESDREKKFSNVKKHLSGEEGYDNPLGTWYGSLADKVAKGADAFAGLIGKKGSARDMLKGSYANWAKKNEYGKNTLHRSKQNFADKTPRP